MMFMGEANSGYQAACHTRSLAFQIGCLEKGHSGANWGKLWTVLPRRFVRRFMRHALLLRAACCWAKWSDLVDRSRQKSVPDAFRSLKYSVCLYQLRRVDFCCWRRGVITRLEAGVWQREAVPTAKTLMAIAFDHDGTGWAGGDGILLRRASDGTWIETPYGSNQAIRSLISIPGGGLIGFGDKGLVIRIAAETASPLLPFPGNKDLLTAVIAGDQIVVAGAQGGAYIGPWMGPFNPIPISTFVDITALTVTDDGSIYAAGSLGHVFVFDGTQWSKIEIAGFNSEITVLIPTEDGKILVLASDDLAIGPFLGIAKYQSPIVNSPWLNRTIEWSFDRLPTPSFTYMGLYGSKAKSAWVVVGPGHIQKVRLPDLSVKDLS